MLFHGAAGIGKSTLLAALTDGTSGTVLRCSPAEEDARLPYAGLVDLFARVPEHCLASLAPEPRAALEAALLRSREPADGRDRLALRVAVLDTLRALASTGPLLLVLDDLQWLDEPTAEVLAFAVRRLDGLGIRTLAAERVPEGEQPVRPHCCPPDTLELPVPPLTDEEVAHLVRTDLGADPPPAALRRIQELAAAGGTGRALTGCPGPPCAGKSTVFKIPSWQTAVQQTAGGGFRQVPDVSAHANPSPGVSIYSQGSWSTVGGTSAAAPEWAAFAALYNQQAAAAGKADLGFANPALYAAKGTGFHDITSGSNGAYSAATGWDFTTGWGSYNAATLAAKLLG